MTDDPPRFERADGGSGARPERVAPTDDARDAVDAAGPGGVVEWGVGVHELAGPVRPRERQTWLVPDGAVLVPTTDGPAVELVDVADVTIHGRLTVDGSRSSGPALGVVDATAPLIEAVHAVNCEVGLRVVGAADHSNELVLGTLRVVDFRRRGLVFEGDVHDCWIADAFLVGADGSDDGVVIATDGVQGGTEFGHLTVLTPGGHALDLRSFEELWLGTAILDSPGGCGLHADVSHGRRLFVDALWTATAGGAGAYLRGGDPPLSDVQVGNWYAWNNDGDGVRVEGAVERVQVGRLNANTNATGLHLAGEGVRDWWIGSVIAYDNARAVVCDGVGRDVHLGRLLAGDEVAVASAASVDGQPLPSDLTAREGRYVGERAYHDGTNGQRENRAGPAYWSAEGTWVSLAGDHRIE